MGKKLRALQLVIVENNSMTSETSWEWGGGVARYLEPRTGTPQGRAPVPEAATKAAAEAAEASASSGAGWWAILESGQPTAGDRTGVTASAVLVRSRRCGEWPVLLPVLAVLAVLVVGLVPVRGRVLGAVPAAVTARSRLLRSAAVLWTGSGGGVFTALPFTWFRFAGRIRPPFR
jgi:hypothetical protein